MAMVAPHMTASPAHPENQERFDGKESEGASESASPSLSTLSTRGGAGGGGGGGGGDNMGPGGRTEVLLSARYNQDASCFACGTSSGFRIYSCDPLKETIRRDFNEGGIGMVEMLFRCNFLALVGGGDNPRYPSHKVMIWDDNQNRCIGELTFRSEVRAVKMRRDKIVVVLEYKTYVYNFSDLKVLHLVETRKNEKGLCGLSHGTNFTVLACPGKNKGQVRVELLDLKKTYFINAHENELACLSMSLDGRRLATASNKGTLVRIFNTADGTQLQELRRGSSRSDIFSIAFAPKTPHLAVSSDKGTVHVFALNCMPSEEDQLISNPGTAPTAGPSHNPASSLSFMKVVLPKYFGSEWSLAQFRIPEDGKSYAAFGAEISVLNVVCNNGKFYKLRFDPKLGGDMQLEQVVTFLSDN